MVALKVGESTISLFLETIMVVTTYLGDREIPESTRILVFAVVFLCIKIIIMRSFSLVHAELAKAVNLDGMSYTFLHLFDTIIYI